MRAMKTQFDGKTIKVPKQLRNAPAGEVLIIAPEAPAEAHDSRGWLSAQEAAFAKVWDNDEDSVYDSL